MIVAKLISRLPFWVLYGFSDFLFLISYYVVRYRRNLVWNNLQNSFPDKPETALHAIEKEFYRNLCDYAVEMVKLLTISPQELGRRMVFTNPEISTKYILEGQSLLNLASHQFNWEWLLAAGSFTLPGQMDFVYQPVNSSFFNRLSLASRTRFGAYAIKRDEVAREIVKRKNIVRNIALVGDQYPGLKHDKKYAVTFLNQDTVFFYGANQLAKLTQFPVMYYKLRKIKRGYYETTIVELAKPPYAKDDHDVLLRYVREIERIVRERPSEWLWSHNRWKKRHIEASADPGNC
ncbi:MAG: lysophospholipid acyltransferase family protein [Cyclobacteriaceae bacterium]|nr:lysophospholipid acyltransferase family protein [Cyclobacteriaceae bacterium]MDH4294877.1 lysophospholipid acyltransferase family protein [Cyclobacteriaceae bacterium]